MKHISVAIDGPSGAGKSTVARAAAKQLGYIYVDTGAMYRAIALAVYRKNVDAEDRSGIISVLPEIKIALRYIDNMQHVLLNNEDVSEEIRKSEISFYASKVSAISEVRSFLLDLQHKMAEKDNIIMDGRDIGTVILPNATVKIYLTASVESRAQRRYKELLLKNENITFEEVKLDIEKRDIQDMTREIAPLKKAEDAVLLDTSLLSLEKSIAAVLNIIKKQIES